MLTELNYVRLKLIWLWKQTIAKAIYGAKCNQFSLATARLNTYIEHQTLDTKFFFNYEMKHYYLYSFIIAYPIFRYTNYKAIYQKMQLSWQKHAPPTLLTLGMQQKYASYMLLDIATFFTKYFFSNVEVWRRLKVSISPSLHAIQNTVENINSTCHRCL